MITESEVKVAQSCLTLFNHMDYTLHGILQARILEWVAFLQEILPTKGSNPGLLHCGWILYQLSCQRSPRILEWIAYPFFRDLPNPGIELRSPALQVDSLPTELWGKPIEIFLKEGIREQLPCKTAIPMWDNSGVTVGVPRTVSSLGSRDCQTNDCLWSLD